MKRKVLRFRRVPREKGLLGILGHYRGYVLMCGDEEVARTGRSKLGFYFYGGRPDGTRINTFAEGCRTWPTEDECKAQLRKWWMEGAPRAAPTTKGGER